MEFVVIGHPDTGKSTLCGRILKEAGFIDEHEYTKLVAKAVKEGKANYVWSWILDIYEEEMAKSKTHEYSIIPFNYAEKAWTLIDTPGHQSFIRSMIGGIAENNPQTAVVLVSMISNEFEASFIREGMLREHLTLARAIGIKNLVILCNKMDQINWNIDEYKKKAIEVNKFITKLRFTNVTYLPVSCYQGIGIFSADGIPEGVKKGKYLFQVLAEYANKDKDKDIDIPYELDDQLGVKAKIFILSCDNIIASGYQCIAHLDHEYEVTLELCGPQRFLKQGDTWKLKSGIL